MKESKPLSFTDLTSQVNLINDLILTDLSGGCEEHTKEAWHFGRHLLSTKYWFSRISWPNKKRYILALLHDVTSAWTLSLLLKSIWNCRLKCAALSISEPSPWSSYDVVPMDNNRTALPIERLVQVMKVDRQWFLQLDPESQAKVLTELLTVAGGPIMWAVLHKAQKTYDNYRLSQLENLRDSCVSQYDKSDGATDKGNTSSPHMPFRNATSETEPVKVAQARKHCEENLLAWNAAMKSLRDSLKLEEVEMSFKDGTTTKVWKVNRPKPEGIETVDFVQLLPSAIAKRILSCLPRAQLPDYAKVNKYWAYLVDELRAEQAIRVKLDIDYGKLQELMLKHEHSISIFGQPDASGLTTHSDQPKARFTESTKFSEKSGCVNSFRQFCTEKLYKPPMAFKPIRNMAELSDRLNRRGAADENVWKWCSNVLKINKIKRLDSKKEGLLQLGNSHFPCPMMQHQLDVPLQVPLSIDPTKSASSHPKRNISNVTVVKAPSSTNTKKFRLWNHDFASLYSACKIPAYELVSKP